MYRKELFTLGALILTAFLAVAGSAWMMIRIMQHQARMVVVDTLPGLINAGEAINRMDNNWDRIVSLTEIPLPEQRSNLIQHLHANTTAEFWKQYQESIFDPSDRRLFQETQTLRSGFTNLVENYFHLVNEQQLEAARRLAKDRLEPAFKLYRTDAMMLFQFNEKMALERSQHILMLARWLPLLAGLLSALIFALGFLFGLRGAFSGLDLVFRRKRGNKSGNI